MAIFGPAYLPLLRSGELQQRAREAHAHLSSCDLCPWECKKDRLSGKHGACKTGELAKISSFGAHHGEEAPLSGWHGSGTIFFSRCNMRCQFCQNHDISQSESGKEVGPEQLAAIMLELQAAGCHNINLVTPTHVISQILDAVLIAARAGLHLPLVYNSSGYDALTALRLLDGVIDIYMPDMKYASARVALHYSKIRDYPTVNQAAVREMHRQVGDLQIDERGLASRGLLVRHLVLPNDLAGSEQIIQFIANEISVNTYLNLMDQYRPEFNARQYQQLNRPVRPQEYQAVVRKARTAGFKRLDERKLRISW